MRCKYCGKGRPKFWVDGIGYCNEECYRKEMEIDTLADKIEEIIVIKNEKIQKADKGQSN